MKLTRHEVNLRRLLAKCELLIKNNSGDARLERYVKSMEIMLQELKYARYIFEYKNSTLI